MQPERQLSYLQPSEPQNYVSPTAEISPPWRVAREAQSSEFHLCMWHQSYSLEREVVAWGVYSPRKELLSGRVDMPRKQGLNTWKRADQLRGFGFRATRKSLSLTLLLATDPLSSPGSLT